MESSAGVGIRCTDLMMCRCLSRMRVVVCTDKSTSHFPTPYGYWGRRVTELHMDINLIRDITKAELDLWSALSVLDVRGNPLTPGSCEVLRNLTPDIIVYDDCENEYYISTPGTSVLEYLEQIVLDTTMDTYDTTIVNTTMDTYDTTIVNEYYNSPEDETYELLTPNLPVGTSETLEREVSTEVVSEVLTRNGLDMSVPTFDLKETGDTVTM